MVAAEFLTGEATVRYGRNLVKATIKTTDEYGSKMTDQGYYTDSYLEAFPVLVFELPYAIDERLPGVYYEDLIKNIEKVFELLFLVLPARVPIVFNTIPYFYVGLVDLVPFKFHVDGSQLLVEYNPPPPDVYLVPDGVKKYLHYDGDLDLHRGVAAQGEDANHVYLGLESSPPSVAYDSTYVIESPFSVPDQVGVIAGFSESDIEHYYSNVFSNVQNQYVSFKFDGKKKIILVDGMVEISEVIIYSGRSDLNNIILKFEDSKIRRYFSGVPLYSVQIMIDFNVV
jgi:hypothetical protein